MYLPSRWTIHSKAGCCSLKQGCWNSFFVKWVKCGVRCMKIFCLEQQEGFRIKNGVTCWHVTILLSVWLGKRTLALVLFSHYLPTSSGEPKNIASNVVCSVLCAVSLNLGDLWLLGSFSVGGEFSNISQHELYPEKWCKQDIIPLECSGLAPWQNRYLFHTWPFWLPDTMCTYSQCRAYQQVESLLSFSFG